MVLAITAVIILVVTTPFTLALLLAFNEYLRPFKVYNDISYKICQYIYFNKKYSNISK